MMITQLPHLIDNNSAIEREYELFMLSDSAFKGAWSI